MGLMDALRNLFRSGGGPGAAAAPVEYNGYRITPAPQRQASGWNTAGVIAKTFDDGVKEHRFIRVDTHASKDDASPSRSPRRSRSSMSRATASSAARDGARSDNLLPCDGIVRLHQGALAEADAGACSIS